jgi:hypothetical protein
MPSPIRIRHYHKRAHICHSIDKVVEGIGFKHLSSHPLENTCWTRSWKLDKNFNCYLLKTGFHSDKANSETARTLWHVKDIMSEPNQKDQKPNLASSSGLYISKGSRSRFLLICIPTQVKLTNLLVAKMQRASSDRCALEVFWFVFIEKFGLK